MKEGLRRIGLLLAIAGAVIGIGFSIVTVGAIRDALTGNERFQTLAHTYWQITADEKACWARAGHHSRDPWDQALQEYNRKQTTLKEHGISKVDFTGSNITHIDCTDDSSA
jgi:hypothetical protein